jgi:hypothetical protein
MLWTYYILNILKKADIPVSIEIGGLYEGGDESLGVYFITPQNKKILLEFGFDINVDFINFSSKTTLEKMVKEEFFAYNIDYLKDKNGDQIEVRLEYNLSGNKAKQDVVLADTYLIANSTPLLVGSTKEIIDSFLKLFIENYRELT